MNSGRRAAGQAQHLIDVPIVVALLVQEQVDALAHRRQGVWMHAVGLSVVEPRQHLVLGVPEARDHPAHAVAQDGEDRPVQVRIGQVAADLQFALALGLESGRLGRVGRRLAIGVAVQEVHVQGGNVGGGAAQGAVHRSAAATLQAEDDQEIRRRRLAQCVQGSLRSTEKLSA